MASLLSPYILVLLVCLASTNAMPGLPSPTPTFTTPSMVTTDAAITIAYTDPNTSTEATAPVITPAAVSPAFAAVLPGNSTANSAPSLLDENSLPETNSLPGTDSSTNQLSCPYFSTPATSGNNPGLTPYDQSSAADKLNVVWGLLLGNQTSAAIVPLSSGLIFAESMNPTVHYQSDFMPPGRKKAVHGEGVVAQVKLVIATGVSPYTGILHTGSNYAIMRFSSVLDPTTVGGPVPSFAIKFFRDAQLSSNAFGLNSEAPQLVSTSPFYAPMTNQFVGLAPVIQEKFGQVSRYVNFTGLSDLADSPQSDITGVHFPWQLIYVPNPVVQALLPAQYNYSSFADYFTQMLAPNFHVPSGTVLYYVYALDKPHQQSFFLGELQLLTDFYRSNFGDIELFFKHTLTEEDVEFRPELGLLCPDSSSDFCQPCPQAYDCLCSDWSSNVSWQSIYGDYYTYSPSNMQYSQKIEQMFEQSLE